MPWTLGSEVHVDNLHARENVHVGGVSVQSDWTASGTAAAVLNKPTTITSAQANAIADNQCFDRVTESAEPAAHCRTL